MKTRLIAISISLCLVIPSFGAYGHTDESALAEIMTLLRSQQAEINALKNRLNTSEVKIEATAGAVETVAATTEGLSRISRWAEQTEIGGYGEIHYNNKEDGARDEADAHRFVLFVGHEFTDEVRFFSEVELEHSLSGEGKSGEVELEQAYIEWDFAAEHSLVLGQFLVPVGIINETHEPDSFFGVERNPVESNIIPATWWEIGAMVQGELAPGLSYTVAAHTGLATPTSGGKAFKVRDGRQKGSKASAEELAYTGRLKYTGITGLELGLAVQHQEDIAQGLAMDQASALFWQAHLAYQAGDFGLRGLYAAWEIDGRAAESFGRDRQKGWFIEPSYRIFPRLGVFTRYSEWDNNAGDSLDTQIEQFDLGFNFWLLENVVLKMDWAEQSGDSGGGDSFNLGVGWSF